MTEKSSGHWRFRVNASDPSHLEARLRLYGIVGAALLLLLVTGLFRNGTWLVDDLGAPRMTDFFVFWSAGRQVDEGMPALSYSLAAIKQTVSSTFGPHPDYRPVLLPYPPHSLFAFGLLAFLPYVWAAIAWTMLGLVLYLYTIAAILHRSSAMAIAAAFPAAWWCIYFIQTGLITAALTGIALALMGERRTISAGVAIGLLSFKPQLGILFPLALFAGREWRVILSASITATALIAASLIAFGAATWEAFFNAFAETEITFTNGRWGWLLVESVLGTTQAIGMNSLVGWTLQGIVTAAVFILVWCLWRREDVDFSLKAAGLSLGALIATPYLHGYDLVGLAVPAAFLARDSLETGSLGLTDRILLGSLFFGSLVLVKLGQPPLGVILDVIVGAWLFWRVYQLNLRLRALKLEDRALIKQ